MANRGGVKRQGPAAAESADPRKSATERLRRVALAGLTLLLVATPLLPSEGPAVGGTGSALIMAVLGLAALVLTGRWWAGAESRWDWADAAVLALVAWQGISGWLMADQGNPRSTINTSWQWVSFGALYMLVRQLVLGDAERRALCAVWLGLATALSTLGYYQFFHSMPQLRAKYAADPELVLRQEGIEAPAGSPERKLFEDRLNSTEPMATFALANSLAGVLAPWLIIGLGIGMTCWKDRELRRRCTAGVVVSGLLIGFCLLLTKSRSAALATGVGMAGLVFVQFRAGHRIGWRIPLAVAAVLGILIGGAIATGAFDLLMVSETPKSLLYRWEYWQATLALIGDHPWLGCGPGNFQQYYASYKLPQASETIADPHNFLLEVWATAGTPAMLGLLGLLMLLLFRRGSAASPNPAGGGTGAVFLGGLAGVLAAWPLGLVAGLVPPLAVFWLGLPAAGAVVYLLRGWVSRGALPVWLLRLGLAVLLLNLSAAGGIGFAGVAVTFWILAALLVNGSTGLPVAWRLPPWASFGPAAVAWVLVIACNRTMYTPALTAQARLSEGMAWAERGRLDRAEDAFQAAAEADPYAAGPWLQLAGLRYRGLLDGQSPQLLDAFEEALRQAELRDRRSYPQRRQAGNMRLGLFRRWGDPQQLRAALAEYRRCAELYPTGSAAYAQLAWTHAIAGEAELAAQAAGQALWLDALTPHRERKLVRQQVFEPEPQRLPADNAEQLMRILRKAAGEGEEMGRRGDGEMGRWGDGETGRQGDREMAVRRR